MSRLFDELRRRNVIRVGIAYLAVAWLVLQVAEMLLPLYGFTDVAVRNLVVILVVGLLFALALAWAFEWLDKMIEVEGPELLSSIDTDLYAKIKSDPRWRSMRDKYGYFDTPVEAIEFTYSLPPGASIN